MDWGLTSTVSKAANKSRRMQVTSPRIIARMRSLWILRRVQIYPGNNVSDSGVSKDRKEFVEVKERTAGCHQRTNDTVYIREFCETIEPRGVVSRETNSGPSSERWGTPQERVENAEKESLIETLRTRWEIRWGPIKWNTIKTEPIPVKTDDREGWNDLRYQRLQISQEECKWHHHDPSQGWGHW